MKNISIAAVVVLLTACQGTLIKSDSSYFQAGADAIIEITQELSVPANSAQVFFKMVSYSVIRVSIFIISVVKY